MADPRDALTHSDKDTRVSAAMQVGTHPSPDDAAPLVQALLDEEDFFVRETLSWALMRVGSPAVPLLVPHLADEEVRFRVLHALSKIGDPSVVDAIAPLVGDVDDAVAAKAAWTLGRLGDPRGIPMLVTHLGGEDGEHRNAVRTALGSLGPEAVTAVAGRLRHEQPQVREHAVEVLTYIGDPGAREVVPELVAALEDTDEQVRIGALAALGELDDDRARAAIQDTVASADTRMSTYAAHLVAMLQAKRV